jgi:enoyl-[acyl-carrier-protein] reductase (NADH)
LSLQAGLVRTESIEKFPDAKALIQAAAQRTPLHEPIEIGSIAGFLLSDTSKWITGQVIIADGGFSLA